MLQCLKPRACSHDGSAVVLLVLHGSDMVWLYMLSIKVYKDLS